MDESNSNKISNIKPIEVIKLIFLLSQPIILICSIVFIVWFNNPEVYLNYSKETGLSVLFCAYAVLITTLVGSWYTLMYFVFY